jgi:Tfp pilus assembly protein PilF
MGVLARTDVRQGSFAMPQSEVRLVAMAVGASGGVTVWLWLATCLWAMPCLADQGIPYIPSGGDIVLQTVPSIADPRVRAFQVLRAQQSVRPRDMALAVRLSAAYLDYGRDTGDARYLGRSAAVIAPWMNLRPVPIPVLLVHATILQSKHSFSAARAELIDILGRQPNDVQALLTLGAVAQVQGDFETTRQACRYLLSAGDPLIPLVCLSSLNSVTGHAAASARVLEALWPRAHSQPLAIQSWMQGIMADTAKYLGEDAAADRHFQEALQLAPGDNFLLADYGDFLLDQRRPSAALELVKDYSSSDTSFLRQVYAEIALHSPRAQTDIEQMARRFAALDQRGSRTYQREEAGFALYVQHDPLRALKLAEENWTVQRAPEDMRVFLEAALAAHESRAAQPVLDQLARSHFQYRVVLKLADRVRHAPVQSAMRATTAAAPDARAAATGLGR